MQPRKATRVEMDRAEWPEERTVASRTTPGGIEATVLWLLAVGGPEGLPISPTETPYERSISGRVNANHDQLIETVSAHGA